MLSPVFSVFIISCLMSFTFVAAQIQHSAMSKAQFACEKKDVGNLRLVKELNDVEGGVDVKAKEGRLEVCLSWKNKTKNGDEVIEETVYTWGTVCDDNFNQNTVLNLCKTFTLEQYGYEFSDGVWLGRSNNTKYKIGGTYQQHFLDEMDCPKEVKNWWECGYSGKNGKEKIEVAGNQVGKPITNCNHKEDVFIECKEVLFCYHCSGDSYDDCSAINMVSKQCGRSMNSCFRKVKKEKGGEMSVTHGCMADTNCTSWNTKCKSDKDNELCYCNACTHTKCNSLFQRMIADFGDYSKDFGQLVEWMISEFTKLMRYVLFDISAYKAIGN